MSWEKWNEEHKGQKSKPSGSHPSIQPDHLSQSGAPHATVQGGPPSEGILHPAVQKEVDFYKSRGHQVEVVDHPTFPVGSKVSAPTGPGPGFKPYSKGHKTVLGVVKVGNTHRIVAGWAGGKRTMSGPV